MAGRQSTVLGSKKEKPRPSGRRKPRKSGLDALSLAENQLSARPGLPRHRFGVDEDGGAKRKRDTDRSKDEDGSSKRRRTEGEESDSDDEMGEDSEGNQWQIGKVDEEDDSEIESDEAFGSSDEERFEDFTFRGSSKPKEGRSKGSKPTRDTKNPDLSEGFGGLSDDEPENGPEEYLEDDDLGEDAVDLATAWDMNAEDSEEETPKKTSSQNGPGEPDEPASESEDGNSSGDDESDLSVSEDEGGGKAHGLSKLKRFVDALEPEPSGSNKPGQGQESSDPTSSRKLTVADLIPTIADSRLKDSLKHLDSTKQSKSGKLEAPLAKRQQDRIDRAAAYQKSKDTLDRWVDTVKANRRAEHLSFPLPEHNAPQQGNIAQSKPRTDLESTVQNLLVESGLAESNGRSAEDRIQEFEELQVNKLPLEEIQARRAELRKARELMFREERRSKRIKKIKSKSYRRVHRKERERDEQKERDALTAAGVDMEDGDRELNDRRRAEARMGAKHKDSKWAKSLKQTGRTAWDEDARTGAVELARREEELQKRMEGKKVRAEDDESASSSSSEESEDESDGFGNGSGPDAESRKLSGKIRQLESNGADESVPTGRHSNLLSMGFMQRAEAARKAANDAEIQQLNRELNNGDGEPHPEEEDNEAGRQRFGKQKIQRAGHSKPPKPRNEFEEPETDDEGQNIPERKEEPQKQTSNGIARKHKQNGKSRDLNQPGDVSKPTDTDDNPWLSEQVKGSRRKKNDAGASTDITLSGPTDADPVRKKAKDKSKPDRKAQVQLQDSEDEEDYNVNKNRDSIVLQNKDLVKKAFADDEVLEDFDQEKEEVVGDEGDKVIDETLPGWGSWTGTGLGKREKKQVKRNLTTVEGVKPERRKDAKLDRVIINEKRVKKNNKYLASQLPHPFETRQQYERSLRLPIGPEWATKETFQDATKPRVMIKQGVIKPMQKPAL